MNIGHDLIIEQNQKLSMTPEMIKGLRILQCNNQELNEYIQKELLENPLLEVEANGSDPDLEHIDFEELRGRVAEVDYNQDNQSQWNNADSGTEFSYERHVSFRHSLTEHLLSQLQLTGLNEDQAEVGRFLIHNIDNNGYLAISVEEVSDIMIAPAELVESTLKVIQTFNPSGVGARNLQETLMIQLKQMGKLDDKMEYIIGEKLEALAANRISVIAKELSASEEEVQEAADLIKSLEPKPGRGYDSEQSTNYVIPDIVLERSGGSLRIRPYEYGAPTLRISSYYDSIKTETNSDPELNQYLREKMKSALWLIKSIEQRRQTIGKVAEAIVDYQEEFFRKGDMYLKPMTLKQIAEKVDMHESTVSRAVNEKYMQCEHGVLELKYFFTSGVVSEKGDGVSSNSIKVMIKDLIDKENPKKPLSDQKIAEILIEDGIDISRRTVTKYRDAMGMGSSSMRRRY